ncbi:hypothetical protein BVX94_01065 [bacterium B17]|nr:hypothetical protein BVX94_01065 [bacterium B17]
MNLSRTIIISLILIVFSAVSHVDAAMTHVIATVTDAKGNTSTKILTTEKFKQMTKRYSRERMYASTVHGMAKKEFDAKYSDKGVSYSRAITQRKVTKKALCKSEADANKKLSRLKGGGRSNSSAPYPQKYEDTVTEAHEAAGGKGGNKKDDKGQISGETKQRRLIAAQRKWITRAWSANEYAEIMNKLIAEKNPEMGLDIGLIENIPDLPEVPKAERTTKKMGTGVKSRLGTTESNLKKSNSILNRKIDID